MGGNAYKKLKAQQQERRAQLRDEIRACFRQTVSLACTRLAELPWSEVEGAANVGRVVLMTMEDAQRDPLKWRAAISKGDSERFADALKAASYGLAGLAYMPGGVEVPLVGLKFEVEAPHPDRPPQEPV